MDTGPKAYGLGRSPGYVDLQQFFQSTGVIVRGICLGLSIIIYFCISASVTWVKEQKRNICVYDIEREGTCSTGTELAMLGIIEGIAMLIMEYFFWKTSSIKIRRRIVRTTMAMGVTTCLLNGLVFLYLFFSFVSTSTVPGLSTSNANFALFVHFIVIFAWAYLAVLEYERFKSGVDTEFGGQFGEETARYVADPTEGHEGIKDEVKQQNNY